MSFDISKEKSKRFVHLDILRLLAIFLVIFNHTGDRGYTLFIDTIDLPISLLYMAASIVCKIAVPLFFMISGALLLKKEESLKQLFVKRILRIAIVLLLVSVPYYYWLHRANGIGILDFLKWIYSESASTSLWYLYSYLALLLMLPFLRSMVKNMRKADFRYLLAGYLIFVGILPCAEYLIFHETGVLHESFSPVMFMTQNVFFALMGHYFEHVYDGETHGRRNIFLGIAFSAAAVLITCLMTVYLMQTDDMVDVERAESFFNSLICLPSITVYCLMKRVGQRIENPSVCKWISQIGSAVFGVYLIEKILRSALGIVYQLAMPFVGSFLASWIWSFAVCCSGLAVIVTLKHIPFIKKIVNKFI